jgi:hypothetical protein
MRSVAEVRDCDLAFSVDRCNRRQGEGMQVRTILLAGAMSVAPGLLYGQFDFKIADRTIQVHSFASQGFAYSNDNNYLTMKTSNGSFAMTDGGANISTQVTDKFRIGAQVYLRNIGDLSNWHPTLDWASADYKFKDWFGIRGGKVKTALGLYNDSQDMDFLHTSALMPQAVYPTDLRDATISHLGGDIYGTVGMKHLGSLSYTAYAGQRKDTQYGGYIYLLRDRGIFMTSYGGLQYGADLKWTTPIKGVLLAPRHPPSVARTGPLVTRGSMKNTLTRIKPTSSTGNTRWGI